MKIDFVQEKSVVNNSLEGSKILVGTEAFKLLEEPKFRKEWIELYDSCTWATAFQSFEFVSNWYKEYQEEYTPILVAHWQEDRLVGLMPLAVPARKKNSIDDHQIRGAGYHYAEYQGWISTPEIHDTFISQAFQGLFDKFPGYRIKFSYLPSQTPKAWLKNSPMGKHAVLQPYKRPIIDLNHPEVSKIFTKRGFKLKRNRLKREGKLSFVTITEERELLKYMDELALQYDFRQGAMFNRCHFRSNNFKVPFLMKLFREGMLHAAILKLDEEVIASTLTVQGKGWVHLGGINTHSLTHAHHSPGMVHFVMLSKQLKQEGQQAFDLTPGEEAYKERLSNHYDEVYELVVSRNKAFLQKRRLRAYVFKKLDEAGKGPMTLEFLLKRKLYMLRNTVRKIKSVGWYPMLVTKHKTSQNYFEATEIPSTGGTVPFQENDIESLMNFDDDAHLFSRWEVLEDAMYRFERGEVPYTWSEGGRLLASVWVSGAKPIEEVEQVESLLLTGFYCHPAARRSFTEFVKAVSRHLLAEKKAKHLHVIIKDWEKAYIPDLISAGYHKFLDKK